MTYRDLDKRARELEQRRQREREEEERQDEMKNAFKEAIHEWLDEKFASFGRWTVGTLLAGALGAIVYAICWAEMKKSGM